MSEDFKGMSAEIAKNFLQTVVVVDDETPLASQNTSPAKDRLDSPGTPASEEAVDVDEENASEELNTYDDKPQKLSEKPQERAKRLTIRRVIAKYMNASPLSGTRS